MGQQYKFDGQAERLSKLIVVCEVGAGGKQRLDAVAAQIDALSGESWRCMGGSWLLLTDLQVVAVRNALRRHLAPEDRLLVALLSDFACWHGFEPHQTDWLLERL